MVPGGTPCFTKCVHSDRDFCYVDEDAQLRDAGPSLTSIYVTGNVMR